VSGHRPPVVRHQVELVFLTPDQNLRVRRSPLWGEIFTNLPDDQLG
jgi:hypothetical protein